MQELASLARDNDEPHFFNFINRSLTLNNIREMSFKKIKKKHFFLSIGVMTEVPGV